MPLDKNKSYSSVSGETPDNCRYVQKGIRYQANSELCKGQKDPEAVAEDTVSAPTSAQLMEQAEELMRRAKAAEAAESQVLEDDPEDKPVQVEDEIKSKPSNSPVEYPIVEQMDGDIGTDAGKPYKTASVAKRAIGNDPLKIVRVGQDEYLLRAI